MKKKVFYNGMQVDAELADGWIVVAVRDIPLPKTGDLVETAAGYYMVVDDGKKRRPTLAPPRTHWRLPLDKDEMSEDFIDEEIA